MLRILREGYDFSRTLKSFKISRALAPEAHFQEPERFFRSRLDFQDCRFTSKLELIAVGSFLWALLSAFVQGAIRASRVVDSFHFNWNSSQFNAAPEFLLQRNV